MTQILWEPLITVSAVFIGKFSHHFLLHSSSCCLNVLNLGRDRLPTSSVTTLPSSDVLAICSLFLPPSLSLPSLHPFLLPSLPHPSLHPFLPPFFPLSIPLSLCSFPPASLSQGLYHPSQCTEQPSGTISRWITPCRFA